MAGSPRGGIARGGPLSLSPSSHPTCRAQSSGLVSSACHWPICLVDRTTPPDKEPWISPPLPPPSLSLPPQRTWVAPELHFNFFSKRARESFQGQAFSLFQNGLFKPLNPFCTYSVWFSCCLFDRPPPSPLPSCVRHGTDFVSALKIPYLSVVKESVSSYSRWYGNTKIGVRG